MPARHPPTEEEVQARVARLARLRKSAGPRQVGEFIRALRDPELPVAKTALMALADRKAHLGPLTDLLGDPDCALRWRACALAWFFLRKDFVPQLIRALESDADPMVRTEAAWALRCADSDAAARALLKAMRDPAPIVAHYAAWVLRCVIRPRCPHLPSLRRARIPRCPLPREPAPRRTSPAPPVPDQARAFAQFACQADLPACRAPLAPTVRLGDLRKAAFARASEAHLIHIDGYPEPPLRRTGFRAVCTPDALHLDIRCRYRQRGELAARHRDYGSPVYADNSVEAFLDPSGCGRAPYYQVCLNTRNARCDLRATAPPGHTWRPGAAPEPWRPKGIRSAVRVEKGCWHAYLTVPFADLSLPPGKVNKVWRMNIVRNAHLPELGETTSWCDMGDYDAHQPDRFGYLWVDAGSVVNASAEVFRAEPLPLTPRLAGWTVLRGRFAVRDGELFPLAGGGAMRWDQPIPYAAFEVSAEVQIRHQVRFLFSPDRANAGLSFLAAYLNLINEINVATMRRWEHWAPAYPGHLSIDKEVYPRLTHSRWYEMRVRIRPDRVQCLLDGALHMELPNPRPQVRYLGLGFAGGGRLRKLRICPLQ